MSFISTLMDLSIGATPFWDSVYLFKKEAEWGSGALDLTSEMAFPKVAVFHGGEDLSAPGSSLQILAAGRSTPRRDGAGGICIIKFRDIGVKKLPGRSDLQ